MSTTNVAIGAPAAMSPPVALQVTVDPSVAQKDFEHPGWGWFRTFSIVHLIFEVVYMILAFLTTIFGFIWPMLVMIGASNVACKCCCTENGTKCIAITMIVMSSIAFIGSFIDFVFYSWMAEACDEAHMDEHHDYCQYIDAAFAWCVICLILRITSIVLAGMITCGPWRPSNPKNNNSGTGAVGCGC